MQEKNVHIILLNIIFPFGFSLGSPVIRVLPVRFWFRPSKTWKQWLKFKVRFGFG